MRKIYDGSRIKLSLQAPRFDLLKAKFEQYIEGQMCRAATSKPQLDALNELIKGASGSTKSSLTQLHTSLSIYQHEIRQELGTFESHLILMEDRYRTSYSLENELVDHWMHRNLSTVCLSTNWTYQRNTSPHQLISTPKYEITTPHIRRTQYSGALTMFFRNFGRAAD